MPSARNKMCSEMTLQSLESYCKSCLKKNDKKKIQIWVYQFPFPLVFHSQVEKGRGLNQKIKNKTLNGNSKIHKNLPVAGNIVH